MSRLSDFISKLQQLPEEQKKIIFIVVIGISAVVIGFFQVIATQKGIANIGEAIKKTNFPVFQVPATNINLPSVNFSNVSDGGHSPINPSLENNSIEKEPLR